MLPGISRAAKRKGSDTAIASQKGAGSYTVRPLSIVACRQLVNAQ